MAKPRKAMGHLGCIEHPECGRFRWSHFAKGHSALKRRAKKKAVAR